MAMRDVSTLVVAQTAVVGSQPDAIISVVSSWCLLVAARVASSCRTPYPAMASRAQFEKVLIRVGVGETLSRDCSPGATPRRRLPKGRNVEEDIEDGRAHADFGLLTERTGRGHLIKSGARLTRPRTRGTRSESAAAMALATSVLLLLASSSLWLVLSFWIAGSKLLPPTGIRLIEWMREDEYYSFLVPLTFVPVALLANYIRWFTNSLFLKNEW